MQALHNFGDIFFSEEFLEPWPLMKALKEEDGCILLIDEIDKVDHEFESLLLKFSPTSNCRFRKLARSRQHRTATGVLDLEQYPGNL